jgi:hypothetical protein
MFVGLLCLGLYLLPGQVTRPHLVRISYFLLGLGFCLLLLPLPLLGVGPATSVHGALPAAVPAFMPSSLLTAMPPPPPAADAPVTALSVPLACCCREAGKFEFLEILNPKLGQTL